MGIDRHSAAHWLTKVKSKIAAIAVEFDPDVTFEVVEAITLDPDGNTKPKVPWRPAKPGEVYVYIKIDKRLGEKIFELGKQIEEIEEVAAVFLTNSIKKKARN